MENFFTNAKAVERLRRCLFGPYLNLFVRQLVVEGYAAETIRIRLRVVRGFARWLKRRGVEIGGITPEHVFLYRSYRIKQRPWTCRCGIKITLMRLIMVLESEGALEIRTSRPVRTPIERVTDEYANHLRQHQNLAADTIERKRVIATRFLSEIFGTKKLKFSELKGHQVLAFVQRYAGAHPKEAPIMTSALRSFLKYLRYRNFLKVDLANVVPSVAQWSMATVPKSIPWNQVKSVLSGCDRRTAIGLRDFAILLLLARLGVRAGEVRALKLEDIDWKAGRIVVYGKDRRVLQLPLLEDVGKAIAAYIRYGRPRSQCRFVFLRARAPFAHLKAPSAVCAIVERALGRAGIDAPRKGAHQFRHGLASELLRKGASLSEIGELLGHRRPDTTAIYAKVDIVALRTIALPWPGGAK